ncbi:MAG TPA: PadR family transcriptional regulator [Longimicrobiales bacterium]|nr:PadR family transcriptional regulator [Longimicrobiales bacterium]
MRGYLSAFEELVLLAALRRGEDAYALTILEEIEERTGRVPSFGSIYVTLDRLEDRGLLRSRLESGGAERAGRPRRYVTPTPAALRALRESHRAWRRMYDGLERRLGHA